METEKGERSPSGSAATSPSVPLLFLVFCLAELDYERVLVWRSEATPLVQDCDTFLWAHRLE